MERHTERVGLIGWPVEHSLSPAMHNAAFRAMELPWRYTLLPFEPGQAGAAVRHLRREGFRGANVTLPHKQAVMPYLDAVSEAARAIGAVNTIVRQDEALSGHNTDADGFLAALQAAGFDPARRHALVLGAGGAARAVVYALARSGCAVVIYNRTAQRAAQLAQDLREALAGAPITWLPQGARLEDVDLAKVDLLVNATSLGMEPQAHRSPWPEALPLPLCGLVFDLVYNPAEPRLVRRARRSGLQAIGGLEMLVQQGALAFGLWTGQAAPVDLMRRVAQAALEAATEPQEEER